MPNPKRWPNHANDARVAAIHAAGASIEALIDLIGALLEKDNASALRHVKRVHTLQTYIQKTLIEAKYGDAPEKLPEVEP